MDLPSSDYGKQCARLNNAMDCKRKKKNLDFSNLNVGSLEVKKSQGSSQPCSRGILSEATATQKVTDKPLIHADTRRKIQFTYRFVNIFECQHLLTLVLHFTCCCITCIIYLRIVNNATSGVALQKRYAKIRRS